MGFNEEIKHDLTLKMRNKTKCGLKRAHLCIWPKTVLRASVGEKIGFCNKKLFWWEIIPILVSK